MELVNDVVPLITNNRFLDHPCPTVLGSLRNVQLLNIDKTYISKHFRLLLCFNPIPHGLGLTPIPHGGFCMGSDQHKNLTFLS